MKNDLADISPVILSEDSYRKFLKGNNLSSNFLEKISKAFNNIKQNKDIILLEGAKSIEDGLSLGISSREICNKIKAKTIVIFKYWPEIIDQILFYKEYFNNNFGGIIINQIPEENIGFVRIFYYRIFQPKK